MLLTNFIMLVVAAIIPVICYFLLCHSKSSAGVRAVLGEGRLRLPQVGLWGFSRAHCLPQADASRQI